MSESEKLTQAIVELNEQNARQICEYMLDNGVDPIEVFDACKQGMVRIGELFEQKEYYLSELIMAGGVMQGVFGIVKPKLKETAGKSLVTVLIGTVEGDYHDIGKNIVISVLEASGYEVVDIGVDVTPDKFVDQIKEHNPQVVGMSGLLTEAIGPMKKTVDAIQDSGLRDRVKIIIGGGLVNEEVKEYVGADGCANDVTAGQRIIGQWVGEFNV